MKFKETEIFKAIFESAGEGMCVVNRDGTILMCNPRMEELFEYSSAELIGQKVEMLIPNEIRTVHKAHRANYHQQPKRRSMGQGKDLAGRKKNGLSFPIEISLNYFKEKEETLVMALITDITNRKLAERELEETKNHLSELNEELEARVEQRTLELKASQRLYSLIARNFPNGTINVFDKELNYVFVEGRELFKMGVTSEMLVGTNYLKRLSTDVAEKIKPEFKAVFEGNNRTFEVAYNDDQYLINAVGLQDAKGEVKQILVVEQNISKQKKAEKDIRLALEKEIQLNELKTRFVSMASHEFRTPLSAILSSASLVGKYTETEQQPKRDKHIQRIKSSVSNLTSILNDFLSLGKLEEGRINNQPETFSLLDFMNDFIEEMQPLAKTGQSITYLALEPGLSPVLDPHLLRNVLINLVSNAIKYSPENKEILVESQLLKGKMLLKVKDQGIGIPEEEQKHLFERFFRARNATNLQGTGLGLNIVKKYIDLMNGNIALESAENQGTLVTLFFPYERIETL